jgi:hypothetical protein
LFQASSLLLEQLSNTNDPPTVAAKDNDNILRKETVEKLHILATNKLVNIVESRLSDSKNNGCQGELIAAQELLKESR